MEQAGEWPIPIIATQDVACGVKLWSTAGRRRATVVVKATFYLVRGGSMRLVSPAPILLGDQHHEGSVERSVLAPSDVSPYLPRAEVLFAGHAYAPTPSPFVPIRLAVVGSRPLVDKTLHVYGERMWMDGDQTTAPVPFTRIPVRYERAYRGAPGFEENPVGMPKGSGLPVHNIIDPQDPETAAGLGPLAAYWPPRRRLLRNLDPSALQAQRPDLPDTFAWSFFHAAPPDQRCSFFEGNEWIVLEGLHPEHPRFESQLPSARARARLYSLESTSYREIGLTADTLWIDGDRSICCVLYRGNFEVESDAMLETVQLFAGLELPGRTIPWPDSQVPVVQPTPQHAAPNPDLTMQSGVVHAGSGSYAAVNPAQVAPGPPIRPPSGQYTSVAQPHMSKDPRGNPTPHPFQAPDPSAAGAGASQSLLAALAKEPGVPPGWKPGANLANPGAIASAIAQQQAGNVSIETRNPESYVNVDAAWLEEGPAPSTNPTAPTSLETPSSTMAHTLTQPPSQLQNLIQQTRAEEVARTRAVSVQRVSIEDSPTVAPDTSDLARILKEADAVDSTPDRAHAPSPAPPPVGARPSPSALRAQKTTIRGLGSGLYKPVDAESAPPETARVDPKNLLQSEESPTAQLPIPDVLLKLAAQQPLSAPAPTPPAPSEPPPTATAPVFAPPIPPREPTAVALDEDDTGRPTLSGMEAPPASQVSASSPQVHKDEARVDLERRIREGESLEGLDLSDLDLAGFDLSGKKLVGCRFDRTNLKQARLRGADLSGASFEGADLGASELDDAQLERTNLVSAKLAGASLRRAFLTDANLTTCDARRAVFDEASGERTIFARGRFDGLSARGSKFDNADFTEARLDGANFDDALLPEVRAYEASAEDASFCRTTMQNARFDGAVVTRARFDGAGAEDSMWDRAVLDGASFASAKLTGASFTKASLRGTTLSGAELGEARFNRANLTGARFVGVDLAQVTLDGADMTGIVTSE